MDSGPVVVRGTGEVVRSDGVIDTFEIVARFEADLTQVAELESMCRAITHTGALRNTLADAAVDALDGGGVNPTGIVEFQTAGSAEVATIDLQNPAFGAASAGTATMLGAPLEDTNATGGVMALFEAQDRDRAMQWNGTVATSGGDINFPTGVNVNPGETVRLTSLTYSAPV